MGYRFRGLRGFRAADANAVLIPDDDENAALFPAKVLTVPSSAEAYIPNAQPVKTLSPTVEDTYYGGKTLVSTAEETYYGGKTLTPVTPETVYVEKTSAPTPIDTYYDEKMAVPAEEKVYYVEKAPTPTLDYGLKTPTVYVSAAEARQAQADAQAYVEEAKYQLYPDNAYVGAKGEWLQPTGTCPECEVCAPCEACEVCGVCEPCVCADGGPCLSCADQGFIDPATCPTTGGVVKEEAGGRSAWWLVAAAAAGIGIGYLAAKKP